VEIVIRGLAGPTPSQQPIEVVERKGLGHPDTLCDAIAEHVCVCLCRAYRERFGAILHHNVDKVLLCGGVARAEPGGGEVIAPIEIVIAGRATERHRGETIPTADIAVEAARERLAAHLPRLDVDRHVRIVPKLRQGSADLTQLFERSAREVFANDSSCGVGFAPATDLERIVLHVEQTLNAPATKRAHPEIGEDVKVMGVRRSSRVSLTIGCAFVSRFVADRDDYAAKKAAATRLASTAARAVSGLEVTAEVNVADAVERGEMFLTVTGTSAEAGDDGEVGRGNRASGLITPYRAMTMEAAAGKNPVSHVGKLYNLAAGRIAATLATDVPGVRDATCVLVSQIGRPVAEPQIVDLVLACGDIDGVRSRAERIVRTELGELTALREALLEERVTVY
jgi:S-adenosylmethionine synthetase